MDFGIFYEIQVNSPLKHREREAQAFYDVLDQVVAAEQNGFSHFWTVEHHFQPGFSHSSAPEVLYGAVSQRTKTIRICHGVVLLPFPYNHPVRVAERIGTLDILSNGRVEVGTGRSATVEELGGFGIPPGETRARWEEGLRLLVKAWTSPDGTFSFDGDYFHIPERTLVPLPLQRPHPRLWLACSNESSHGIAGQMGLGLMTLVIATRPEDVAKRIEKYEEGIRNADPVSPVVNNQKAVFYMAHCAETNEKAQANAERSFISYVDVTRGRARRLQDETTRTQDAPTRPGYGPSIPAQEVTFDWMIENRTAICGDPDTCIRQIEDILDVVKVDQLMLMKQFWGVSHEDTMKSIELFGKYVIPHFAAQGVQVEAGS